jgi:hypothetical protein
MPVTETLDILRRRSEESVAAASLSVLTLGPCELRIDVCRARLASLPFLEVLGFYTHRPKSGGYHLEIYWLLGSTDRPSNSRLSLEPAVGIDRSRRLTSIHQSPERPFQTGSGLRV